LAFQSHEDAPADPVEPSAKRRRHGQKDGDGDSILAFFLILRSRKMSLCAVHLVFGHTSAFFSKSFSFHFDDGCG